MHKVYLILRNNKQQGPYSLEELLEQSLKPMDLVWVEGKSAGWRYPSEIEALKPFLQEAVPVPTSAPAVPDIKQEDPVVAIPAAAPVKSSFKKIFVRMPFSSAPAEQPPDVPDKEAQLAKKAEELYRRAQAYTPGQQEDLSEPSIKYSRSLEDIKEEYSSWLYEQKTAGKRKRIASKKNLLVLAALPIIGFIIYFLTPLIGGVSDTASDQPVALQTTDLTDSATTVPARKKTVSRKKTPVKRVTVPKRKLPTAKKPVPARQNHAPATASKQQMPAAVSLPDLIHIETTYAPDDEKGIPEFNITVKNNSEEFVRFVAVNVYYYRDNGSTEKKTLYFRELSPHQSLTQKAPAHKKASDVRLQMGLLSSNSGDLYYASN